ncbi:hypothetical protein [Microbulbifer discodermiae]|uniref:hypothetical protein n=1 Tax=Microbulbifer sp. 2201CG32-9 TaxID=3232309 RepID=UPI00345BA52C
MEEAVNEETMLEQATSSLLRIQEFDAKNLPRFGELERTLNFPDVVEPVKRLIELYRRLAVEALEDFPYSIQEKVKEHCDNAYKRFEDVINFEPAEYESPSVELGRYVMKIMGIYDSTFTSLHPYISYSLHRSTDLSSSAAATRSVLKSFEMETKNIKKDLLKTQEEAANILLNIRNIAAEEGVTQQAIYFKEESEGHDSQAASWRTGVFVVASLFATFAITSIFLHKWTWLAPTTTFETAQLVTSKLVIFGVLAYLLIISVRNYLNHKHNSIVNKHRQNALMTYKAMVEATDDAGSREAILIQAAACIYNPQATGYASAGSDAAAVSGKSMVEILSKPVMQAATGSGKS